VVVVKSVAHLSIGATVSQPIFGPVDPRLRPFLVVRSLGIGGFLGVYFERFIDTNEVKCLQPRDYWKGAEAGTRTPLTAGDPTGK
jgi:hypothetical protein